MKKLINTVAVLLTLGLGLVAPGDSEAGFGADIYIVPVVARNPGTGGSDWRTEMCLTNPQIDTLTVGITLIQGGPAGAGSLAIPGGYTVCSEDFLLEWFGATKWQGGMVVGATANANPGLASRQFMVSVRVYNFTPSGTFGLSVQPEPYAIEFGNIGDIMDNAGATGLHHWGTAGVSGFRSSVGAVNYSSDPKNIYMFVVDENNFLVWEKSIVLEGYSQKQFGLPKNLTLSNGAVGVTAPNASISVQPYVTVTDNETGDGRYISCAFAWTPWARWFKSNTVGTEENGTPWDLLRDVSSFPVIRTDR